MRWLGILALLLGCSGSGAEKDPPAAAETEDAAIPLGAPAAKATRPDAAQMPALPEGSADIEVPQPVLDD